MNIDQETDIGPWYKQFWAWFILSPLILVVIVSSITVSIAVKYKDDRVVDNYYKEGRMINMRLDQDLLASQLSVSADIEFNNQQKKIFLTLDHSGPIWPDALSLELSHPVKADLDHTVALQRVKGKRYQADIVSEEAPHRWYLRLTPQTNEESLVWRLRGEIDFRNSQAISLKAEP